MWIFGCFQFERGSLVMSYLFTIFLSLQGVLVFVMHCLLSKQVREEYARILTSLCAQKKKSSEFSTNQSSKSQLCRHPGASVHGRVKHMKQAGSAHQQRFPCAHLTLSVALLTTVGLNQTSINMVGKSSFNYFFNC
ncbi:hypothetical protein SRHO_G00013350 [Serrasalmus rhombeus]